MKETESKVEETLRLGVEEIGGRCIKLPAILYRGIPDRLVVLPGAKVFFIELKKDGARTDKGRAVHQKRWREFLCKLGFICLQLEGMSEVKEFLDVHCR